MSDYSPIGDDRTTTSYKAEHSSQQGSSFSSHPYLSAYGNRDRQQESQTIQVGPPTTTSGAAGDYNSAGYRVYGGGEPTAGPSTFGSQDGGQRISRYETSLSLRYDMEASLAYAMGIFSGSFLLVTEKKNDYVRFHAWQSSLLSAVLIFAMVIAALISSSLYYIVILAMIVSQAFMARRAYFDGAVFQRFELPYIGPLASQFVDEE